MKVYESRRYDYNSSNSPLADIIRFDSLRIIVSLTILKRVCYGDVSTAL